MVYLQVFSFKEQGIFTCLFLVIGWPSSLSPVQTELNGDTLLQIKSSNENIQVVRAALENYNVNYYLDLWIAVKGSEEGRSLYRNHKLTAFQ